jgi:hypothetical protein
MVHSDGRSQNRAGNRAQSDAEIEQEFQLRFKALGGEGTASPQKAMLLCRTSTRFFGKWDTKVGLMGAIDTTGNKGLPPNQRITSIRYGLQALAGRHTENRLRCAIAARCDIAARCTTSNINQFTSYFLLPKRHTYNLATQSRSHFAVVEMEFRNDVS